MSVNNLLNKCRILLSPAVALLVIGVSLFTACENDDTDFSSIIDGAPDYELKDISFNYTPIVKSDSVPADDNDYVENSEFSRTVTITYNDGTATVETKASGIASTVDGAHVTINTTRKGVHYIISGTSANGSLKIYSERKFWLTMNGVNITNPHGAAINNQCGKSMYVELAAGTNNSLTDGLNYIDVANEDQKGTLFSEGQIIFSGTGTLNVTANSRNGIASDDYIVFRPGSVINVTCVGKNCVKANDGISLRGSVLNLESSGMGGKAVNCEANVEVRSGRLTAIASGQPLIEGADTTNVAALKCDSSFVVSGGEVNLKCTADGGKGLNANGDVTIYGGNLTIESVGKKLYGSPKALKCDGVATIHGGTSYIYSANSKPIDAGKGLNIIQPIAATYSKDGKLVRIF